LVLVLRERGAVSPHARRYAARLRLSRSWRGRRYPTRPRSAPTPSASRRETRRPLRSVTLPAWPLPAFRSAAWSVVPPLRAGGRPSAALFPRASVLPLATGLLMPRARGRARGTPSPPARPVRLAPGWTPGLARCGAGPRRLCVAPLGRVSASAVRRGARRRASSLNASDALTRHSLGDGGSAEVLLRTLAFLAPNSASLRPLPCRLRRSGLGDTTHFALLASPEAQARRALLRPICPAVARRLPAARRNSQSQKSILLELRAR